MEVDYTEGREKDGRATELDEEDVNLLAWLDEVIQRELEDEGNCPQTISHSNITGRVTTHSHVDPP